MGFFDFRPPRQSFSKVQEVSDVTGIGSTVAGMIYDENILSLKANALLFQNKQLQGEKSTALYAGTGKCVAAAGSRIYIGTTTSTVQYTDDNGATYNNSTGGGISVNITAIAAFDRTVVARSNSGWYVSTSSAAPASWVNIASFMMPTHTSGTYNDCLKYIPEIEKFVAVGSVTGGGSVGRISISSDGLTWQFLNLPNLYEIFSVTYYLGELYLFTNVGVIYKINPTLDITTLQQVKSCSTPKNGGVVGGYAVNRSIVSLNTVFAMSVAGTLLKLTDSGFVPVPYWPITTASTTSFMVDFNGTLYISDGVGYITPTIR